MDYKNSIVLLLLLSLAFFTVDFTRNDRRDSTHYGVHVADNIDRTFLRLTISNSARGIIDSIESLCWDLISSIIYDTRSYQNPSLTNIASADARLSLSAKNSTTRVLRLAWNSFLIRPSKYWILWYNQNIDWCESLGRSTMAPWSWRMSSALLTPQMGRNNVLRHKPVDAQIVAPTWGPIAKSQ